MLSSLSSTIITVFDIADLSKSTPALFPAIRAATASSPVPRLATQPSTGLGSSAETLRKHKWAIAAMSGRPDRRDIHGAAAERDVEGVSAEQVDQGNEDEQEGRPPSAANCRSNAAFRTPRSTRSRAAPARPCRPPRR